MNRSGLWFYVVFIVLFAVSCERIKADDRTHVFDMLNPESEYIAVFGDIQYYTNSKYIDLFMQSVDWIDRARRLDYKIKDVLHTGDITQSNNAEFEWQYFDRAMNGFSSRVPFISVIGDHDYSWNKGLINDRDSTLFSEHVCFPLVTSRIEAAFEPGRMENIVIRNYIQGKRYDFLLLEFGPRKEVVDWADEWVSSHPDVKYILLNHEYLEKDGGRRTVGLKCKTRLRNTTYTTPDELWNSLIKCNDNIRCVLCGHVGSLFALTLETNDFGRDVPQVQHNIQGLEFRYDNWLMLWEFPKDSDSVSVMIINTRTGELYEGKNRLFQFSL